jgi:hypothetical protein
MVTLRRTWRLFWSWTLVWAAFVVAFADGGSVLPAVAAGVAVAASCLPFLRVPLAVAAALISLGVSAAVVPAGVLGIGVEVVALLVVAGLVARRMPAGVAVWVVTPVGLAAVFAAVRWGERVTLPGGAVAPWGELVAAGVAVLLAGVLAGAVGLRVREQRVREAAVAEELAVIVAEARAAEGDVTAALDRIEDAGQRALARLAGSRGGSSGSGG